MLKCEGEVRIPSGCAISGIMNKKGDRFSGVDIINSIALMRDRSNGLGGGFAAYGIYPDYKECYAIHVFYNNIEAKEKADEFINRHFEIEISGKIPTQKTKNITHSPIIWRYFVVPKRIRLMKSEINEEEYVARCIIKINSDIESPVRFYTERGFL